VVTFEGDGPAPSFCLLCGHAVVRRAIRITKAFGFIPEIVDAECSGKQLTREVEGLPQPSSPWYFSGWRSLPSVHLSG
jgi:hypothetical protein